MNKVNNKGHLPSLYYVCLALYEVLQVSLANLIPMRPQIHISQDQRRGLYQKGYITSPSSHRQQMAESAVKHKPSAPCASNLPLSQPSIFLCTHHLFILPSFFLCLYYTLWYKALNEGPILSTALLAGESGRTSNGLTISPPPNSSPEDKVLQPNNLPCQGDQVHFLLTPQ